VLFAVAVAVAFVVAVVGAGARPFGFKGRSLPYAVFSFRCHPEAVRAKRGWARDLLLPSFAVAGVKVCVLPFLPLFAFRMTKEVVTFLIPCEK